MTTKEQREQWKRTIGLVYADGYLADTDALQRTLTVSYEAVNQLCADVEHLESQLAAARDSEKELEGERDAIVASMVKIAEGAGIDPNWGACPSEMMVDLVNERDEARDTVLDEALAVCDGVYGEALLDTPPSEHSGVVDGAQRCYDRIRALRTPTPTASGDGAGETEAGDA